MYADGLDVRGAEVLVVADATDPSHIPVDRPLTWLSNHDIYAAWSPWIGMRTVTYEDGTGLIAASEVDDEDLTFVRSTDENGRIEERLILRKRGISTRSMSALQQARAKTNPIEPDMPPLPSPDQESDMPVPP